MPFSSRDSILSNLQIPRGFQAAQPEQSFLCMPLCHWTVLARLRYFRMLTLFTGLPGSIPKITLVSYTILLFLAEVTYVSINANVGK